MSKRMTGSSREKSAPSSNVFLRGFLWFGEPVFAGIAYMAAIAAITRFWTVYQYNTDEGFNLMKTALITEGYSLYSEIWSDQPPFFSLLLVPLHSAFPGNVTAARLLVLFFAGWIICSLFRIVRRACGRAAAWVAVLTLASITIFQQVSVTVLIGMPAVAFALAGIDQALAGAKSGSHWRFVASGVLIALGLQTKLFVFLMIPVAVLAPFTEPRSTRLRLINVFLLLAATIVATAVIVAPFGEAVFAQLINPHVDAVGLEDYAEDGGFLFIFDRIGPYWYFVMLAVGVFAVSRYRRFVDVLPLLWLALAMLVLEFHQPFHFHHATLFFLPIAWLCGIGVTAFADPGRRRILSDCTRRKARRREPWQTSISTAHSVTLISSFRPGGLHINTSTRLFALSLSITTSIDS